MIVDEEDDVDHDVYEAVLEIIEDPEGYQNLGIEQGIFTGFG